jgi:hypothetical protein
MYVSLPQATSSLTHMGNESTARTDWDNQITIMTECQGQKLYTHKNEGWG